MYNLIFNVFTTKIMKMCISIAMSVCLSIYLSVCMEQFKHHLMDFPDSAYWDVTLKLCLWIHIENLLMGNILGYKQSTWSDFFSKYPPALLPSFQVSHWMCFSKQNRLTIEGLVKMSYIFYAHYTSSMCLTVYEIIKWKGKIVPQILHNVYVS